MARFAPAVARLIEVNAHAVAMQVDDVGRSRAVDVGQPHAPLLELVRVVEPWRVVHGDLGAEAAIAEIRPVADLAVSNPDEVDEAIAAQIGEIDRLRLVGEHQTRAALFVARLMCLASWTESVFREGRIPCKDVVFRDEDVGVAVTVQVDKAKIGLVPAEVRQLRERAEGLPALVLSPLVEAGRWTAERDDIELPVAREIKELRATTCHREKRRLGANDLQRSETAF